MATVVVAASAASDLARLIETRGLPANTRERVRGAIAPLATFPLIGRRLTGRWQGVRLILGPWSWMLVLDVVDEAAETVTVVAIHDARTRSSATTTPP